MNKHTPTPWLSDDQVFELNEKFGWMQKADAQSDQSRAFIQAAIDKHERIRKAAPELLSVVSLLLRVADGNSDLHRELALDQNSPLVDAAREAIAKAEAQP